MLCLYLLPWLAACCAATLARSGPCNNRQGAGRSDICLGGQHRHCGTVSFSSPLALDLCAHHSQSFTVLATVQLELQAACEELGLDTEGSKPSLVASIMSHFEATAPVESERAAKPKRIVMNQSAAKAPPALSEPAAQPMVSTGDKREDLAARVKALDSTIKERTQQLEELRNTDKCATSKLLGLRLVFVDLCLPTSCRGHLPSTITPVLRYIRPSVVVCIA